MQLTLIHALSPRFPQHLEIFLLPWQGLMSRRLGETWRDGALLTDCLTGIILPTSIGLIQTLQR